MYTSKSKYYEGLGAGEIQWEEREKAEERGKRAARESLAQAVTYGCFYSLLFQLCIKCLALIDCTFHSTLNVCGSTTYCSRQQA